MTFPKPVKDKEGVGLFLDLQGQALEPGKGLVYPGTKGQRRGRNPSKPGSVGKEVESRGAWLGKQQSPLSY